MRQTEHDSIEGYYRTKASYDTIGEVLKATDHPHDLRYHRHEQCKKCGTWIWICTQGEECGVSVSDGIHLQGKCE